MEAVDVVETVEMWVVTYNTNSVVLYRDKGGTVLVLPSRDVQCWSSDQCRYQQGGDGEEDGLTGTVDHGLLL